LSAAAACVRHPAGHAVFVYLSFDLLFILSHLVPAAAGSVRHSAAACCWPLLFIIYYLLFIIYLVVCNGSMR
jgi:hypothetical protein